MNRGKRCVESRPLRPSSTSYGPCSYPNQINVMCRALYIVLQFFLQMFDLSPPFHHRNHLGERVHLHSLASERRGDLGPVPLRTDGPVGSLLST